MFLKEGGGWGGVEEGGEVVWDYWEGGWEELGDLGVEVLEDSYDVDHELAHSET